MTNEAANLHHARRPPDPATSRRHPARDKQPKSSDPARNFHVVNDFLSRHQVLPDDEAAGSQHYGQIRSALEKAGKAIGVNDLHFAAHARSQRLTLVTSNLREFGRVPDHQKQVPQASSLLRRQLTGGHSCHNITTIHRSV